MKTPASQDTRDGGSLVSVIIPTHNRAGLIGETLESVLAQDHRPIEIVIVDDGSTDDTEDVVRSFESRSGDGISLQYFRQEKAGAQVARNRGMRESRGEYIQFLDSDDLIGPRKLGLQVATLAGREGPWVAYGPWRCLYDNGRRRRYGRKQQAEPAPSEDWMLRGYLSGRWFCPPCCYLFTRDAVEAVGPWDESLRQRQDTDYVMRTLISGCRFVYVKGTDAFYRRHTRGHIGSPAAFAANLPSMLYLFEKTRRTLVDLRRLESYKNEIAIGLTRLADDAEVTGFKDGVAECGRVFAELGFPADRWQARSCIKRRAGRLLRTHIARPARRLLGEDRLVKLSRFLKRLTHQ